MTTTRKCFQKRKNDNSEIETQLGISENSQLTVKRGIY